jgi:hypothetical protein
MSTHSTPNESRTSQTKTRIFADLFSFLIIAVGIQLRYGYGSGVNDHFVLSPLGISWSDPSAFANDYFVFSAPQPHIFFDFVTSFGYSIGALSATYFSFWLVTIAVSALAIRKISEFLSPERFFLGAILGSLFLVAGPVTLLGTTTIALPQALPHALGGALALLTFSFCLEKKWSLAGFFVLLSSVAHVQQGTIALAIFLFFLILDFYETRALRIIPYIFVLISSVLIVAILNNRPVLGKLSDFVRVCNEYIPYHCDSNSWAPNRFVLGLCAIGLVIIVANSRKALPFDHFRIFSFTYIIGGLVLLALEFINFPILGELIQGSNGFRVFSLLIPLGAISAAWVIIEASQLSYKKLLLGLASIFVYLTALSDVGFLSRYSFFIALILILFYFKVIDGNADSAIPTLRSQYSFASSVGLFASISIIAVVASGLTMPRFEIGFMSDYKKSFKLEQLVPSGETIAADPTWTWVRLASKRAVIVDCKYLPYGGAPLTEFEARIKALGGYERICSESSYGTLKPNRLDTWADKFSAKYLLLEKSDKRIAALKELGWTIVEKPGSDKIEVLRPYDKHRIRLVLLEKTG